MARLLAEITSGWAAAASLAVYVPAYALAYGFANFLFLCNLAVILVAVGIFPNSQLARVAGLELGPAGSISIDRHTRTSDPDIYAAGDCADAFHVVTGEKTWVPLALRANRAGWAVADNVTGNKVALEGIVGTAVFKVFDLQIPEPA